MKVKRTRKRLRRTKRSKRAQLGKNRRRCYRARRRSTTPRSRRAEVSQAKRMAYELEHKIGFFDPENVKRIVRASIERGDTIASDDMREYVGLAPAGRRES